MAIVDFEDKSTGSSLTAADINLLKRAANLATRDTIYVNDLYSADDGDDIGPALNRAFRAIESVDSEAVRVVLARGEYNVATNPLLPAVTTTGVPPWFDLVLDGAVLTSTGATHGLRRTPTSYTNMMAINRKMVPRISGGSFQGFDYGVDIGSTYGARLSNVDTASCGTGFRLAFCMAARVEGCFSTGFTDVGFDVVSGDGIWSGASKTNACSNLLKLDGCRCYSTQYNAIQYRVMHSDSVHLSGCIAEGPVCKYNVQFVGTDTTVLKLFKVSDFHAECLNSDTIFDMETWGQNVLIDTVDRGALPGRFLRVGCTAQTRIFIKNWPYMGAWAHPSWTAGSYSAGDRVTHSSRLWTANTATSEEPGTGLEWDDNGDSSPFRGTGLSAYVRVEMSDGVPISLMQSGTWWMQDGVAVEPSLALLGIDGTNGYFIDTKNGVKLVANDSADITANGSAVSTSAAP